MKNATRLLLAIATMAIAVLATPISAGPEPTIVVVKGTADDRALVDEVVELFDDLGVELPPIYIEVAFHRDKRACHGNLGYYAVGRLDMCNIGDHHRITPMTTLLHEFGHAVTFHFMTEEERQAFVDHRQLEVWHGADIWWDNGQEQAAEIVAWAVGGALYEGVYLDSVDHAARVAAARLLLGGAIELPELVAAR